MWAAVSQLACAASAVAARLGVKPGTVYYWLNAGLLPHRKRATGAVCIPFSAKTA